ncbi:MAG: GNAT family N-acetyltransferase [Candidatus Aenigmarchaeota archaeon]|nr:GNAT family N-acetyltransferase [Candidatus Aenigmarchaeota archaeon]
MNVKIVAGIKVRYLRVRDLLSLDGFTSPEVQKPERRLRTLGNRPYELYYDFEMLRETVMTAKTDESNGELHNDPHESYSIAKNGSKELVGFASTGGIMSDIVIEGRYRKIPDVHYVDVHPEYRGRGIGTALVEKLLQHHTFLTLSSVSYLGDTLTSKLLHVYGHPEDRKVIRAPKRTRNV